MKPKTAIVFLSLMACAACASSSTKPASSTNERIAASVRKHDPRNPESENYLRYLLADAVFGSALGEVRSAQLFLGVDRACELIIPLYAASVDELRPSWSKIYGRVAAELEDLPDNRRRRTQLSLALSLNGLDLIEGKAAVIRTTIMKVAAKVDQDSVDYKARLNEISLAESENRQSCGLIRSAFDPVTPAEK